MKKTLFKGKSSRTKIFTALTAVLIVLLLGVNMLFTYASARGQLFVDMTSEGFYTLSDKMISVCREILDPADGEGKKKEIKITFCADPDSLTASKDLRPSYFMALQLQNMFDNVSVEEINLMVNPTAVDKYKSASRQKIRATDIIVSYGDKYRVLSGTSMWTSEYFSYNGEFRMAQTLASLVAVDKPKAYFLTGHGETCYLSGAPESESSLKSAALADLLDECGLETDVLDLSLTDAVPEDCVLLIINNPTEDLEYLASEGNSFGYVSEAEKLDRYLVSHGGSVIFTKDYSLTLPVFEEFFSEWGISFNNYLVKEDDRYLRDVGEDGTAIIATYDTDELSYGYAYYSEYAGLSSAPQMIFTNTGFLTCSYSDGEISKEPGAMNTSREYAPFIGTTKGAVAYDGPGSTYIPTVDCAAGYKALCAASVRSALDSTTGETTLSYLFCANTEDFLSNELLGNQAYANYSIMATVVNNLSRTDRFVDIDLGGLSANSGSYGGKQSVSTTLSETNEEVYAPSTDTLVQFVKINYGLTDGARVGITLFVCAIPLTAIVLGAVMFIKRKFL